MCDAAFARQAWRRVIAPTTGHFDVFFNGIHNLGNGDISGSPRQSVPAGAPARALNKPGSAQLGKQLLKVCERQVLAFCNG